MALNAYIRKEESIKSMTDFHLKELEKEEQIEPKVNERREK